MSDQYWHGAAVSCEAGIAPQQLAWSREVFLPEILSIAKST